MSYLLFTDFTVIKYYNRKQVSEERVLFGLQFLKGYSPPREEGRATVREHMGARES